MTRRVAILGAGARGGRWARRFHRLGWEVRLFDPLPAAEGAIPLSGDWSRRDRISDAVAGADWIMVNLPERLELLQMVIARAQAAGPKTAIVAATSRDFDVEEIQGCAIRPGLVVQVNEGDESGLVLGVTDRNDDTVRDDARLTLSAIAAQMGLEDTKGPGEQSGVINLRRWTGQIRAEG